MSIYSGFGTRKQETAYNKAVFVALYMLQQEVVLLRQGKQSQKTQREF